MKPLSVISDIFCGIVQLMLQWRAKFVHMRLLNSETVYSTIVPIIVRVYGFTKVSNMNASLD